ncbi:MAG TPA: TraB/GumN family protein, partial [Chitinophagaceae bacterium]|nr:TraB/GumN family protein [Chitinophagaceae bacterium]
MKKIFISIGLLALVTSTQSQTKSSSKTAKTTTTKKAVAKKAVPSSGNTLLYEITGNGLKKPSYIFGTMHLLCEDDARLSPNLKKAIASTNQIYFEIDMDDFTQTMGTLKYIRMNDNTKLSDLITPEEYARVKKYFTENPAIIPFAMMERFKPFMLTALISESGM